MENEHVFVVVNESGVAFLAYRWLLDHGVPMVGNGQDGTYYQQKGNENILTAWGNAIPYGDVTYDTHARVMKQFGAKKVGVVGYSTSTSSVAVTKAFTNYAAPKLGLEPVYTNTSVDFGTSDVGPLTLGLKNAGADAVNLLMVTSTNVALAQALQTNGADMKVILMATGYGQDFLGPPRRRRCRPARCSVFLPSRWKSKTQPPSGSRPTSKGTRSSPAYPTTACTPATSSPTSPSRASRMLGISSPDRSSLMAPVASAYDQAGLACKPVDVTAAAIGKASDTACIYLVQLKR